MAMQLNPYLTFPGNAEEAMTFYQSIFGGELSVSTFRESGMEMDGVMHASLDAPNDVHLFASDHAPGMTELTVGNNVQISLSGNDEDALRGYWAKLSEGGSEIIPLAEQMWGDTYGQVLDRYRIAWHVNIAGS